MIGYVDSTGAPKGWLFDGLLVLDFRGVSNRFYVPSGSYAASNGDDWRTYLDSILSPSGAIVRADSAAAIVDAVGASHRILSVALMIPYPDTRNDSLVFLGTTYDMKSVGGRRDAVAAYVKEASTRFASLNLQHSRLAAYYWLDETVPDADTSLIPQVAAAVHASGARFFWIPFFGAKHFQNWRAFGFDDAWLQPNYFFHPEVPASRIDSALVLARGAGLGMEMEFDKRMFSDSVFAGRIEPYLKAFDGQPYLRGRTVAVYEGGGALMALARSHDPKMHEFYERLVTILTRDSRRGRKAPRSNGGQ